METNYFGALRYFQAALPSLRAHRGCVVPVQSLVGKAGTPYTSLYAASKVCLESMSPVVSRLSVPTITGPSSPPSPSPLSLSFPPLCRPPYLRCLIRCGSNMSLLRVLLPRRLRFIAPVATHRWTLRALLVQRPNQFLRSSTGFCGHRSCCTPSRSGSLAAICYEWFRECGPFTITSRHPLAFLDVHAGRDRIKEAMPVDVCARKCLETAAAKYDERNLPLVCAPDLELNVALRAKNLISSAFLRLFCRSANYSCPCTSCFRASIKLVCARRCPPANSTAASLPKPTLLWLANTEATRR